MSLSITVEIDEPVIREATRAAVAEAFSGTSVRPRGFGLEAIREQVRAFVASLDVGDQIRAHARVLVSQLVHEVVSEELRRHIRDEAKRLRATGELFGDADAKEVTP